MVIRVTKDSESHYGVSHGWENGANPSLALHSFHGPALSEADCFLSRGVRNVMVNALQDTIKQNETLFPDISRAEMIQVPQSIRRLHKQLWNTFFRSQSTHRPFGVKNK